MAGNDPVDAAAAVKNPKGLHGELLLLVSRS
jgi:hypothetical protein